MPQNLNQAELQTIRALLNVTLVEVKKLSAYAESCHDSDLKTWLQSEAKTAKQTAQQLFSLVKSSQGT